MPRLGVSGFCCLRCSSSCFFFRPRASIIFAHIFLKKSAIRIPHMEINESFLLPSFFIVTSCQYSLGIWFPFEGSFQGYGLIVTASPLKMRSCNLCSVISIETSSRRNLVSSGCLRSKDKCTPETVSFRRSMPASALSLAFLSFSVSCLSF